MARRGQSSYYMLVRQGKVQRLPVTQYGKLALMFPVAESVDDAQRLAVWTKRADVRPALIGFVQGETMEGHLQLAIDEGCIGMCCVAGWNADGSPIWKTLLFD